MKTKLLSLLLTVSMIVMAFCSVFPVTAEEDNIEIGAPASGALGEADAAAAEQGYVCRIGQEPSQFEGNETLYRKSFLEAMNAARAGGTITLIADVERTDTNRIEKSVTIDGNGYTYTAEKVPGFITDKNSDGIELIVKNLTVKVVDEAQCFIQFRSKENGNKVICEKCTFETDQAKASNTIGDGYFWFVNYGGYLDMTDCEIKINAASAASAVFGQGTAAGTTIFDIHLTNVTVDVAESAPNLSGIVVSKRNDSNIIMDGNTVLHTGNAPCVSSVAKGQTRITDITLNGTSQLKSGSAVLATDTQKINLYINDEASLQPTSENAVLFASGTTGLNVTVSSSVELKGYAAPQMQAGASVRIAAEGGNGLRFRANYNEAESYGILLARYTDIAGKGAFTVKNLDEQEIYYQKLVAEEEGLTQNADGTKAFTVSLMNAPERQYGAGIAARAYAVYSGANGTVAVYSPFTQDDNVRSLRGVSAHALADLADTVSEKYANEIKVDGISKYSPYTQAQYDVIKSYVVD